MNDAMTKRPFAVLGVQQIAIGARDKTRLRTLWVDMLGLQPAGSFRSERENVDEDICSIGSGATRVEVDRQNIRIRPIEPTEGNARSHSAACKRDRAVGGAGEVIGKDGDPRRFAR